jgi:hypothetical protein
MLRITKTLCLLTLAIVVASGSICCRAQQVMDNAAVLKLTNAGLSEDLIVSSINGQPGNYSVGTDDLVALKKAGVSERVIGAMIAKNNAPAVTPAPVAAPPGQAPEPTGPTGPPVLRGGKVFIAPMQGNLDGFLSAEILKQKLPLMVVTDEKQADLVITGMNVKEDDHWYNAAWGGKDKNEGSIRLIQTQNKSIIWAGDAGDRSLLFSGFRRGGLSKVAERLVRQMNKDVFKK